MSGFVKNGLTGLLAMALATPASVFAPLQTPPEIAKKAFASTVVVTMAEADGKLISLGSGFFVRPDQVVTNYHVIEGAAKGYVKFVGKSTLYAIDGISAMDEERDLALLKIVDAKAPVLTLAENDGVEVGETVYAIGNPEGLEGTFSQGIVSGIRDAGKDKWVQITAPISSGSSGGPVVNAKGLVIGVAVASVVEGQNLNFAIPVGPVKALMASSGPTRPLSSAKKQKLVLKDTKEGTGPAIEKGDTAYLLYAGRLVDGTEFDSNLTAKFPFSVTVGMGQVIKGWDEGLVGLKVGGKRILRIPSEMGYGPQGSQKIPANSDLIFDVELVDLVKNGEEDIVDWNTLTPGSGAICKAGDKVTINYVAFSPLNSKFEEWSNQKFKLGRDGDIGLPGLDFGITGMKVGEKRRIRLPSKVGYGPAGRSDLGVPPNMVVYFEVTLKGIG